MVSISMLAVLGAGLGVSFTADTGVTSLSTISANPATGNFVYPASYGGATTFPTAVSSGPWKVSATTTPTSPAWSPVANQAGSVTTAGDLAFVDASSATTSSPYLLVTVYVTNLSALSKAYGSYAWPIRVYKASSVATNTISWNSTAVTDANGVNTANTYLTNTQGFESFKLPAGTSASYYDITMDAGGSYFTLSTSAGSLTPTFYVTATPSS